MDLRQSSHIKLKASFSFDSVRWNSLYVTAYQSDINNYINKCMNQFQASVSQNIRFVILNKNMKGEADNMEV